MKFKQTYILLIASVFISKIYGQNVKTSKKTNSEFNFEIDTIIEKCNPKTIDLSRHQLFIDTTRTYEYYDKVENSNPFNSEDIRTISNEYLKVLYIDTQFHRFNFQNFPRLWIPLKKYQGNFILYDRCDGSETYYGITDSLLYIFGVHEFDLRKIKNVKMLNNNEVEIELEKYKNDINTIPLTLKIQMTSNKDIYTLTTNLFGEITTINVIPNFNVRKFNVLVNHCPINKVKEFDNKLDKEKIDEPIEAVKNVFDNYTKYNESTDSQVNIDLMTKSLKSLDKITELEDLEILINIWMYYDPADIPIRDIVFNILQKNKPESIQATKLRISNKKEWESDNIAPYSELNYLLKKLNE